MKPSGLRVRATLTWPETCVGALAHIQMAFMPQFVAPSQLLLPQLAILFSTFLATSGGRILHRIGAGSLIGASALVAAMRRP